MNIKVLLLRLLSLVLIVMPQFIFAQEKCAELKLSSVELNTDFKSQLITFEELATQLENRFKKADIKVTKAEWSALLERLSLVIEVIKADGKLDQFFKIKNLDPATATVYLYGTTASYYSFNPLKSNHHWSVNSDIDLIISVKDFQGKYWQLIRDTHKPFSINNVPVEVQSLHLAEELDYHVYNETGIEIMLPAETQAVPAYAILVRQFTTNTASN